MADGSQGGQGAQLTRLRGELDAIDARIVEALADRLRVIVNALTRLRFVTPGGAMDLKTTGGLDAAPAGFVPWFDAPGRQTAGDVVAFGHWSTLAPMARRDVLALDTGCVWGGCLTALRLGADRGSDERIEVRCEAAQQPGE